MISSCSLPMVSKLSTTSPSGSSFYKLYHQTSDDASTSSGVKLRSQWEGVGTRNLERGSSKGSENQSINEIDEWNKIDDILSSFGGAVCRESVFAANFEPQVAVFLRDRRSQALTLQLTSATPPKSAHIGDKEPESSHLTYSAEADGLSMSQWLSTSVGIPTSKAVEVGQILTTNGFDRPTQLNGCLTAQELSCLGIEKTTQHQILSHLATVDDPRPNANNFNYVSDWLCSLELTDYLGNFVAAGLKTMLVVRTAELSRKHLEKMGITLRGHIARILHSLAEAKAEDTRARNERLKGMEKAVTSRSIAPCAVKELPLEERVQVTQRYRGLRVRDRAPQSGALARDYFLRVQDTLKDDLHTIHKKDGGERILRTCGVTDCSGLARIIEPMSLLIPIATATHG
ncbi:hypothetical protein Y032_0003g1507 [Ancylostoma ceylanicum]|uniref:SAM domain-containing protein n=1 Tax=Ancylostoma ceylanicum TaxID=53326 RepID=A0A016VY10_9BILA|nr:hypothetical protein Y032_0003g1507 [Ancylostoma ceylanicum]